MAFAGHCHRRELERLHRRGRQRQQKTGTGRVRAFRSTVSSSLGSGSSSAERRVTSLVPFTEHLGPDPVFMGARQRRGRECKHLSILIERVSPERGAWRRRWLPGGASALCDQARRSAASAWCAYPSAAPRRLKGRRAMRSGRRRARTRAGRVPTSHERYNESLIEEIAPSDLRHAS